MNAWPLDESSYVTFENTVKDIFGKTNVKIDIVDIFNSEFLLYSNRPNTNNNCKYKRSIYVKNDDTTIPKTCN